MIYLLKLPQQITAVPNQKQITEATVRREHLQMLAGVFPPAVLMVSCGCVVTQGLLKLRLHV